MFQRKHFLRSASVSVRLLDMYIAQFEGNETLYEEIRTLDLRIHKLST